MSITGGPIDSAEVIQRAMFWITNPPPNGYNQGEQWHDSSGKDYRTDCSGFVSMAWHLAGSPNTAALVGLLWTIPIGKESLAVGDILVAPGNGNGHAVIFVQFTNADHTEYEGLEFGHGAAPIKRNIVYPYDVSDKRTFTPHRYPKLIPTAVKGISNVAFPSNAFAPKTVSTNTNSALFATGGFAIAGIIAIVIILTMLKF